MAVMTSITPDTAVLEHKTQPVPSSPTKMALDLDINGTSTHDEPSRDTVQIVASSRSEVELQKSVVESKSELQNRDAFEANRAVADVNTTTSVDKILSDATNGTHNIKSTEDSQVDTPVDAVASLQPTSEILPPSDEQLDAISDIPPTTSSFAPVIEAPQSDLREEILTQSHVAVDDVTAHNDGVDMQVDSIDTSAPIDDSAIDNTNLSLLPSNDTEMASDPVASPSDQPLHPHSISNIDLNEASQSAVYDDSMMSQDDTAMLDAPSSPSKLTRPREDDGEEGPSTKRTKTEDDPVTVGFAVPSIPAETASVLNGEPSSAKNDDVAPNPYQVKEMLKVIKQQKVTVAGKGFREAVTTLWPTLAASYQEKVKNPVDLSLIEERLKDGKYDTIADFKSDLNLMYDNCVIFNGREHVVTAQADTVRKNIIAKIPGPEPVKVEKKPPRKSSPLADLPPRAATVRRPSRGAVPPPVAKAVAPVDTYALAPSGTPLIRRDSTTIDNGRPKREIHPPKPRDLVYNSRPKKKYAQELKFCNEVLTEIKKAKHAVFNSPFMVPVDPVALGIPDYFKVIKHPMDFQTVTSKLTNGEITTIKEFESDMRLIFKNCFKFNPSGTAVNVQGKQCENFFNEEMAKKSQWLADHQSEANINSASATETDGEDEDESDAAEDEPVKPSASHALLQARLVEEQNKMISMMKEKSADVGMVALQDKIINVVKAAVDDSSKAEKAVKPKSKAAKAKKPPQKRKTKAEKPYKVKHIGMNEKEAISAGISQLQAEDMNLAIGILQADIPDLDLNDEELDIEQFSNTALSKLLDLVVKKVPGILPTPSKSEPRSQPKQSRPKKNKPMSKTEQEAKIEKLKHITREFDRRASEDPISPAGGNVLPTVEQDSSGDEDSSDSEED